MTELLLNDIMKARIARGFTISEDKDHAGQVRVFNKDREQYMRWAFASADAAMAYIAGTLLEEDLEARKKDAKIDPRIRIIEDFEGDWVIQLDGPTAFGTFGCERDARPLAADLSKMIVSGTYYKNPHNPRI